MRDVRWHLKNVASVLLLAPAAAGSLAGFDHAAGMFLIGSTVLSDWRDARWLPRWRRFLPALFLGLSEIAHFGHEPSLDLGCVLLWLVFLFWNSKTAWDNERSGKDPDAAPAGGEQVRLTEVQAAVFRREAKVCR